MQQLAHQVHIWFRTYVREDIHGYVKNFGNNEVIQERVGVLLGLFSSHLVTILSKLIEGMSSTYLKYLFEKKSPEEVNKKATNLEEFERLANQWSMHHLSPKTLNMSITSIQSAISREVMWDAAEAIPDKELKIPSGLKLHYQKYIESPETSAVNIEECPKTEKMYERIEFMRQAGKAQIQNLVFPNENSNPNASTSRCSKENSLKRLSKKLKICQLTRVQSKENSLLHPKSDLSDANLSNNTPVNRWISTKQLQKCHITQSKDTESTNPYINQNSTTRNLDTPTPLFSLKSTTVNSPSNFDPTAVHLYSPSVAKRSNAATPMLDGPKLTMTINNDGKKRSGSGEKHNNKIIQQWVNFKIGPGSKHPKGRNKVKLACSNTLSYKSNTSETSKKNLIKTINLKTSPKYITAEGTMVVGPKNGLKNAMVISKTKVKTKKHL